MYPSDSELDSSCAGFAPRPLLPCCAPAPLPRPRPRPCSAPPAAAPRGAAAPGVDTCATSPHAVSSTTTLSPGRTPSGSRNVVRLPPRSAARVCPSPSTYPGGTWIVHVRRLCATPLAAPRPPWLVPPAGAGRPPSSPPSADVLTYFINPTTTALEDRRSTPSARADRQEPLPMFGSPCRVFPTILITYLLTYLGRAGE